MLGTLGELLEPIASVQALLGASDVGPMMVRAMIGPGSPVGPGSPFGPKIPFVPGPFHRRPPPPPPDEPVWDTRLRLPPTLRYLDRKEVCAVAAAVIIASVHKSAPRYEIQAIDRPNACAGFRGTIKITGHDFGSSGFVLFPSPDGPGEHRPMAATQWSDTAITVKVPSWATPGELRLQIIEQTVHICGSDTTIYRLGNSYTFGGGAPTVFSVSVNGQTAPACVPPDADVTVAWVTTAGPLQTVNVTVAAPGSPVVTTQQPSTGIGSLNFHTPRVTMPTNLTVTVALEGGCESLASSLSASFSIAVPSKLSILGMEVTQGVQHFDESFSGMSPLGPPVPTVAGKKTIVRAYIGCERNGFALNQLEHVSGRLTVAGLTGLTLKPLNTTTARHWSMINRTSMGDTLNFLIPAAWCDGTRRLELVVWGEDECGMHHAYDQRFWTWQSKSALRVRFVRIRDGRPGSTNPVPIVTEKQAQSLILRAFDFLPSPPTDISPAWLSEWNTGENWLDQSKGGGQQTLLNHLNDQHNCSNWEQFWPWSDPCPSDDGAKWVGVEPEPSGGGMAKREGNTCVAGLNPLHVAHELGHTLGLKHQPDSCGSNAPPPDLEPTPLKFDGGLLFDVAVDPTKGTTVPRPTKDLMSYGCNRWTSADTWNVLYGKF